MKYGRYKIINELGRGAMGVVYKAHDPRIDREIALKVLRADRVTSEDFLHRFLKEAKAIGRLSHHNIVTVHDVGQDHDTVFIAMELLEGLPLNELNQSRQMSMENITDICAQIADALDYAHDRGIIHRDIKPTNIIVTPDGKVKLTDFGIARIEDPTATQQTQAGEILGTPSYMSAEQVMGKTIDRRSDLYSLGVILYELCTGDRPFKAANISGMFMAITQETPPPPAEVNASIPRQLSELIIKSLCKKPDDRFQTGKEMAVALRDIYKEQAVNGITDKTVRIEGAGNGGRMQGNGKSRTYAFSAIVSIIILSLLGGGYFFMAKHPSVPQGTLAISSQPQGAHIFINGSFKGKTPLSLPLALGKYELRASLPDYLDWEGQVTLSDKGKTLSLPTIRLFSLKETEP